MGKMATPFIDTTSRKITELGLQKSSAKLFPPNSVILSTRAPIGHLAINTSPMSTNQGCKTLVPNDELHNKYLYYFLYFNKDLLDSLGTGTTFIELSGKNLKEVDLPVPPLEEQKRIVSILDDVFEGIDNRTVQVVNCAQSTIKLHSSRRDSVYSELLANTESVALDKLCYFENGDRGKNYPSRSTYTETGIPMISAAHLGDSGLDMGRMNFIPRERFELLRAGHVAKGDLLYCLRGSLGKCAIVSDIKEGAIASSLVIVRTGEKLNNLYLLEYLKSRHGEALIRKYSNGTAQPNLSAKSLRKFIIPVASNQEQIKVVNELQELKMRTNELANSYQNTLQNLEQLKQSILQEAFNGELTKGIPV